MRITFAERPIYQAPLSVLEHLYYYTIQYGLSVRQFTGAHWRYWEKLPKRLSKVQNDPEGLEEIIAGKQRGRVFILDRMARKGKCKEKFRVLLMSFKQWINPINLSGFQKNLRSGSNVKLIWISCLKLKKKEGDLSINEWKDKGSRPHGLLPKSKINYNSLFKLN